MIQNVNVFDYTEHIIKSLKKGVLLTTQEKGIVNTMTIGWGAIGIEWNRPVFIAYIRESRYTRELLDRTGEFTINIPLENSNPEVLRYCGTKSGREVDKISALGLTTIPSKQNATPGILEFPLTLECRVICRQKQDVALLPEQIQKQFYPGVTIDGFQDSHIAYYGEIVNAYLIER